MKTFCIKKVDCGILTKASRMKKNKNSCNTLTGMELEIPKRSTNNNEATQYLTLYDQQSTINNQH